MSKRGKLLRKLKQSLISIGDCVTLIAKLPPDEDGRWVMKKFEKVYTELQQDLNNKLSNVNKKQSSPGKQSPLTEGIEDDLPF